MERLSVEKRFSDIDYNVAVIKERIAQAAIKSGRGDNDVHLMAVTKTVEPIFINRAISNGIDLIGENKVQELLSKTEFLNTEALEMHIIGHLQSNKVRKIINTVSMIQSVDSISLIEEISRQAVKNNRIMEILLEVNIDGEESKTGLAKDMLNETAAFATEAPGIALRGIMSIPPVCEDEKTARRFFEKTRLLYEDVKCQFGHKARIDILSMGMSSDFEAAVQEG